MIQRIQTIYLLLVAALMATMLLVPMATAQSNIVAQETVAVDGSISRTTTGMATNIELSVWSLKADGETVVTLAYFAALVIAVMVIAVITIFMYRNRTFQIRMCYVMWILTIGIMAFQAYYYYHLTQSLTVGTEIQYIIVPSVANACSLVSLILVWLAYRGIIKDEALVRSADRLR